MKSKAVILITIILFSSTIASAQTYWVSPAGQEKWENCKSEMPLNDAAACSVYTASNNAVAGDTVFLRGGIYWYTFPYSASIFLHTNSGTPQNPIIFSSHGDENVVFDGNNAQYSTGIKIDGQGYIKVDGVHFRNYKYTLMLNNASHNEISRSAFENIGISIIQHNSTHNWIHDSNFSKAGKVLYNYTGLPDCSPQGLTLQIGDTSAQWYKKDLSSYNLLENNTFFHGAHDLIEVRTPFNVIRNNYWHNEEWMSAPNCGIPNDVAGNRLITDFGPITYRNLYEYNRVGFSGIASDYKQGGEGIELAGHHSIVRFNFVFNNKGAGIYPYNKGLGGDPPGYNYIYSNTVYHNGYNGFGPVDFGGIQISNSLQNIIKNNIVYNNFGGPFRGQPVSNQIYGYNWTDSNGDPLFMNTNGSDPFDRQLPDLRVKATSPVIDAGGFLTAVTSPGGTGTTFTVNDPNYFMDGWGIIRGDTIQLEGQGGTATITSVNYDTNTLTVDKQLSWSFGQGISLAYSGAAPDIGAFEYPQGPDKQSQADDDSDGVPNTADRCPKTALAARSYVNSFGCAKPVADKFDIKPDFNATDINGMHSLELGILAFGKILYAGKNILLVKITAGEDERLNLDTGLNITQGKITLNQSSLPQLSQSATITLYNTSFNSPKILRDGEECKECTIHSYDRASKTLAFSVPGF